MQDLFSSVVQEISFLLTQVYAASILQHNLSLLTQATAATAAAPDSLCTMSAPMPINVSAYVQCTLYQLYMPQLPLPCLTLADNNHSCCSLRVPAAESCISSTSITVVLTQVFVLLYSKVLKYGKRSFMPTSSRFICCLLLALHGQRQSDIKKWHKPEPAIRRQLLDKFFTMFQALSMTVIFVP